jgi:aspartate kinase
VDEELGSVSVISLGIGRKPDITMRALAALEEAGITAALVTTTPGRMTAAVPSAQVEDAARLLHALFIPAASTATVAGVRAPVTVAA